MRFLYLVILFFTFTEVSFSHSGGLNQDGCHNNRKTGGYHCHRSKSSKSSKKYICKLTIDDQYYDFDPSRTNNIDLKFDPNNGDVKLNCKWKRINLINNLIVKKLLVFIVFCVFLNNCGGGYYQDPAKYDYQLTELMTKNALRGLD